VWKSTDGTTWNTAPAPSGPAYDEMTVVAPQGDELVAIGQNGSTFQAWRLTADGWQLGGRFGAIPTAPPAPGVRGTAVIATDLAAAGDSLVGAVILGGAHDLWWSSDHGQTWRPAAAPMTMPAGAGLGVALAGIPGDRDTPDRVILAVDDGTGARLFLADAAV
jgi:hypothetical protein